MKRWVLYYVLWGVMIFVLSSDFQAFAGTRGRRFLEDDTNVQLERCKQEKRKKENFRKMGREYKEPRRCDPKVDINKQRGCLDPDCDLETGQIRY